MSLREYSTENLLNEIHRREDASLNAKAKPIDEMDWKPVVTLVENAVSTMRNEGYQPKDFEHFIFERTMEVIYGENVWEWYNDLL